MDQLPDKMEELLSNLDRLEAFIGKHVTTGNQGNINVRVEGDKTASRLAWFCAVAAAFMLGLSIGIGFLVNTSSNRIETVAEETRVNRSFINDMRARFLKEGPIESNKESKP